MLLLLPSHAGLSEEVSGFAHPGPGGTGMLKVPGQEVKSVTNLDPPAWGSCNSLNLIFLPSTCAAQLESGWRVQLFGGFCASLWSIQAEHCQIQHPTLSH